MIGVTWRLNHTEELCGFSPLWTLNAGTSWDIAYAASILRSILGTRKCHGSMGNIHSGDFLSGLFPRVFQEFLIQLPTKPSPFGWKLDGFIFGSYKQMSSNNFLVTCGYREFNWDNSHCPHPIPKARLESFQNPLNRSQRSQTARWDEKT